MMSPELKTCADSDGPEGSGDDLLTVHLRGDDLWAPENASAAIWEKQPSTPYVWGQPPCRMYEKILLDTKGKYRHLLLVTSPDRRNPCIQSIQDLGRKQGFSVRVQSGSLLQDSCALLQARHLVVSFSTLPESLAFL